MTSYGRKRRPLANLREWGKQKKALREQSTNDTGNLNDQQDTMNIDKEDIEDIPDEQDQVWAPDSPIYVPPATFSSPDVSDDDLVNNMQVTTHTTMEINTIDALNANNVLMICSERDKMKLEGILKNHPLLFHSNRILWPILFVTYQLKGLMPLRYEFDNPKHTTSFKLLLAKQEDQVLEALKKTYPATKCPMQWTYVTTLCSM